MSSNNLFRKSVDHLLSSTTMAFEQRLSTFALLKQDEMIEKYQDLIEEVLSSTSLSNLNTLVTFCMYITLYLSFRYPDADTVFLLAVLNDANHVPNAVSKAVLYLQSYFKLTLRIILLASRLSQCLNHLSMAITPIKAHGLREVAEHAVTEIKKSVATFDEAVSIFQINDTKLLIY